MTKRFSHAACAVLLVAAAQQSVPAQPPAGFSEHGSQQSLLQPETFVEPTGTRGPVAAKAVTPAVKPGDFVVLGYVQSNTPRWTYHWHTLTHIALPFTAFNADGNITNLASTITNRSALYRPNGIADRHGVKVKMALINSGFTASILNDVMNDPAKRTNLATQVAAAVNNPADNIAGVNLDFEPLPYGAGVGQGIVDFIVELRTLLNPGKEISFYVGPTYSAGNYPNLATAAANLDFFNFSCYPWSGSWSNTSTSINPLNSYRNQVDNFLNNGVPPEKMVLTLGAYGHRMFTTTGGYGATKVSDIGSTGFADQKFATTLSANAQTVNYHSPSESPWYSFFDDPDFFHVVYEDEVSLELKMRHALSWSGSAAPGARLGGVGFWSLAWHGKNFLGGYNSYDMEANSSTSKIRMYPHIFQRTQEIFAPPGTTEYLIETWEYDDALVTPALRNEWDRWRNPNEGPDNLGVSSVTRAIVPVPAGPGRPQNSDYCNLLNFTFTATANNRFFYRWEILGDNAETTVRDNNATRGFFPRTSRVLLDVYTPVAYPGRTASMIFLDGNGQLEKGPAISLNESGWRTIETDVANASFTAYNTSFNQYVSGNGTLDTAGGGARDIAFIGLLVEGGGAAGSGSLYIDQLRYARSQVGGLEYRINEFSYRPNAGEFVEIHGTPGIIPAGVELRVYTATNGDLVKTVSLAGLTIPANGIIAVGDPGVAGVASSAGFSNAVDDLPNTVTTGLQLYNSATGGVYDSVVYRAYDGIGLLSRSETNQVTGEGWPWLGEVGPGNFSAGRFPDGRDTNVNYRDFVSMAQTPGLPNNTALAALPITYNFSSTVPGASTFQAYNWANAGVVAPGVPASPNGGNVYRVADSSGGNIAFFTDTLSLGDTGHRVMGQVFIPAFAANSQAIGIGICGTLGSTFFTANPASSGYENGYWLIYHNNATININTGLGNHSETFKFVMAQNNNMQSDRVVELASVPRAATGVAGGTWTTFLLEIDPQHDRLLVQINNAIIYDGPIPEGGRTSGSFQGGHRNGTTGAADGLWLDALTIEPLSTGLEGWMILGDS